MIHVFDCYCLFVCVNRFVTVRDLYSFTGRQDNLALLYFFVLSSDDYDDVQPMTEDFPPPPLEIRYLFTSVPLKQSRKLDV